MTTWPAPRPLTALEHGVWTASTLAASPGQLLPFTITLTGDADAEALRAAVAAVLGAHPDLAARVGVGDGTPTLVPGDQPVEVAVVDVADGPGLRDALDDFLWAPIDLARGPLCRARVHRISARRHVIAVVTHHLVSDGVSKAVLVDEIAAAFNGSGPVALAAEGSPADDWTVEEADAASRHWSTTRSAPTAGSTTATGEGAGTVVRTRLSGADAAALARTAADTGVSRFEAVLALFRIALGRVGVGTDLVGVDVSARRPGDGRRVGMVVNQLVVELPLDERRSFAATARDLGQRVREARRHRFVPYARVAPTRPSAGRSLTPVTVSYRRQGAAPAFAGLAAEIDWACTPPAPRNDVHLQVVDGDDWLDLTVHGTAAMLGPLRTHALSEALLALLADAAATPDAPVRLLDAVVPDTRRRVVETFNAIAPVGTTAASTVVDRIRDAVATFGGRTAVADAREQVTYAVFGDRVAAVAARLHAAGVAPGDVVGVCSERSVALVVGTVAVLAAGAVYLPLDPDHPAARLAGVLRDAQARHLLVADGLVDRLPGDPDRLDLPLAAAGDDTPAPGRAWPAEGPAPADPAYLIFTSGSTGRPKGVLGGHAGLDNRLAWMAAALAVGPDDVVAHKTPTTFDVSLWELLLPLTVGARVEVAEPGDHRDPAHLHAWVDRTGVTLVHFVPSMLASWLESPSGPHPRLRTVVASGEALPPALAARVHERWPGLQLVNLYGPTEASIDVSVHRYDPAADGATGGVPIGRPVDRTRLYVLDARHRLVAPGVEGELFIAGVGLAFGYRGDPVTTAVRFVPDPFGPPGSRMYATGDRVRASTDGTLLYVGRVDDQLKHHGHRIEPGEIETHLGTHPSVVRAVAGLVELAGNVHLAAWYLPTAGADPGATQLRAHLAERVPASFVPTVWTPLTELPLTASGKLDRGRLPAPRPPDPVDDTATAAGTTVAAEVLAVIAEVLGHADLELSDDLFDHGVHSLMITQIAARTRRRLGVDLPLVAYYDAPTIGDIVEQVERARPA